MNQLPPDHQSQRKQERAQQQPQRQRHQVLPWQWYRGRTLKAKVALGSALVLVLLLLLVGVSVLTTKWLFSIPHRVAGVHITVTAGGPLYVSPSGNDSNDGSIAHPFASIQQASKVARPGTTIHVLPGMYTKSIYTTAKGTAQARITFISDVKWGAKISTTGVRTSWTNFGDFVDIQGFDITGDGDIGINNYGSYVHIIGNHVHNYAIASCGANGTAGNNIVYNVSAFGIQSWHAAASVTIANNLVFHCGQGGILIAANQTLADNFLVVNNIVVHNLHLGIYEYGQTGLHNRFLNNLVYANPINLLLQHGNKGQGTIVADPRFVNFQLDGSGDYHLAAGSPAIGAGTSTGEPTADVDGFSRTIVTAVDLGPYAYRSNNASRRHILKKLH